MKMLEALLNRFARRTNARWWIGTRPEVRKSQLPKAIASQVGLPTSTERAAVGDCLMRLSRAEAAHVLAVAGTTSLAYGRALPRSGALEEVRRALGDFAENATFMSNGRSEDAPSVGWSSLTSATFEYGVIGFDEDKAFVFWVEEED